MFRRYADRLFTSPHGAVAPARFGLELGRRAPARANACSTASATFSSTTAVYSVRTPTRHGLPAAGWWWRAWQRWVEQAVARTFGVESILPSELARARRSSK